MTKVRENKVLLSLSLSLIERYIHTHTDIHTGTGDNLEDLGDFDAFLGLDLDGNGMGDGSDDKKTDELSSLKDDLRKKKSEVEDQKFFLNDCDETMRKQIKEDISFLEGEIKELEEKIRALES